MNVWCGRLRKKNNRELLDILVEWVVVKDTLSVSQWSGLFAAFGQVWIGPLTDRLYFVLNGLKIALATNIPWILDLGIANIGNMTLFVDLHYMTQLAHIDKSKTFRKLRWENIETTTTTTTTTKRITRSCHPLQIIARKYLFGIFILFAWHIKTKGSKIIIKPRAIQNDSEQSE